MTQLKFDAAPSEVEYVPSGHAIHALSDVAFDAVENLPAEQKWQV